MRKNEQGFTLVELMIGMAILALIMSGIYGILASSVKSYQYNFEQGKNIQDSRQIFNELTKGIKNATAITTPTNTSTLDYSVITDTYRISLNTTTSAVDVQKNSEPVQSFAIGRVNNLIFTPFDFGSKTGFKIQLTFKSNPSEPMETTVTTLNDIP